VLVVDPPEEEMSSYTAVRDVYRQKVKYGNSVTGYAREKFVPLFARTTLVEHNGVTPGTAGVVVLVVLILLVLLLVLVLMLVLLLLVLLI
jgi:hypothetical protein